MGELDNEMPEIQQRLLSQQEQLQDLGKTIQGTIVIVNLHCALLNNTFHALDTLSEVVKEDITYVRVVRHLMQDLIREISSSVSSLSGGKIPTYLVPLDLVEKILCYCSAIPISVDPKNLEIGFILNLPIVERQNIYRLVCSKCWVLERQHTRTP